MALILPNSIFIHIPKTGGTWVRRAIEASMGLDKDSHDLPIDGVENWESTAHATFSDVKKQLSNDIENKLTFAFVRNPLDILKSAYIEEVWPELMDEETRVIKGRKKISFSDFVLTREEGHVSWFYRYYLKSHTGIFPSVDYIGRTENLKNDLIEALEIAGEEFDKEAIERIPPVRMGASLEVAKKVIKCSQQLEDSIMRDEQDTIDMFYSDNKYSNLQNVAYDNMASMWSIKNKNFVTGPFNRHNKWEDYNFLFSGMFDFHDGGTKLPLAKNMSALDFGCGPGRNLEKYSSNFKRVDGVDISHVNLDNAKKWLKHTGSCRDNNLFKTNGTDLREISDSQYDVVMSTITLQHISVHEVRLNLFKEFYRVLVDSGWFTAQMGYGEGKLGAVPYYKNYYNSGSRNGRTDVYVESPDQLKEDLYKVGFNSFDYEIRPTGPADKHPNWIFFRAKKVQ